MAVDKAPEADQVDALARQDLARGARIRESLPGRGPASKHRRLLPYSQASAQCRHVRARWAGRAGRCMRVARAP